MAVRSKKISTRLKLGRLKLNVLLDVTKAINNNSPKEVLLDIYRSVAKDQLMIGKMMLFYLESGVWTEVVRFGEVDCDIEVERDLINFEGVTVLYSLFNQDKIELADHFDVLLPIYDNEKPLAFLLLGDFEGERLEVSPIIKHLPFIQTITNIIIVAIENKRLYLESLEQVKIKKELELASQMQNMFIPRELPNDKNLEIGALYKPHQTIGGDYYDIIQLNDEEIGFCIADISGKGISAALLMSNFQATLRALFTHSRSMKQMVEELNSRIIQNANREKFLTAFFGRYHIKKQELTFINAGHNPPILMRDCKVDNLEKGCTILGMFDKLPSIEESTIKIKQSDFLLCYTDGLVEQPNKEDEEFGEQRIEDVLTNNCTASTEVLLDKLMSDLDAFRVNEKYIDDIALFGIRFK